MKFKFNEEKKATYKHYDGQDVDVYVLTENGKDFLTNQGIDYLELPIASVYDVLKLHQGDETLGYVIIDETKLNGHDDIVYVIEEMPIDCNWDMVVKNANIQDDQGDPMSMPSRFRVILEDAESEAKRMVDVVLSAYKKMPRAARLSAKSKDTLLEKSIVNVLFSRGYDANKLENMPADDVDPARKEYIVNELKKAE